MDVKIKRLHPAAIIPSYGSDGAACFDLHAVIDNGSPAVVGGQSAGIWAPGPETFRTGLAFEIPTGFAMLVFSRSGHGFKDDIRLANCVGVIDADYRGEVMVKLTCDDSTGVKRFSHGDRIAQAIILPYPSVRFLEVVELSTTQRGAGGFGSTGT